MWEIGRDDKFELKVVGVIGGLFRSFDFRLRDSWINCLGGGGLEKIWTTELTMEGEMCNKGRWKGGGETVRQVV